MIALSKSSPSVLPYCILDHEPAVRAFLARRVPSAEVDDALQTVLVKAWRGDYDPSKACLKTWLLTIARNVAIDLGRTRNGGKRTCRPQVYSGGTEYQADHREPSPDARLMADSVKHDVTNLLATLRPRDAELLRRHYLDGRTLSDVAGELGIPVGTVKSRLSNLIAKLRRGQQ